MRVADTFSAGIYREGDSLLHRFDPRLKLLLMFGLVACVFSATSFERLLLIFLIWIVAASCCKAGLSDSLNILKMMRWLLLFALLLHLCLTPGRTLFGTRWLSYDGLLNGLLIDAQLLLAIFLSLLLAWTTRPESLAWAVAWLLSPLQKLRIPVRETVGLLMLVLHFFPLIQVELAEQKKQFVPTGSGLLERIKVMTEMVGPLLFRLVERADQLAVDIASGDESFVVDSGPPGSGVGKGDLLLFVVGLSGLLLLRTV